MTLHLKPEIAAGLQALAEAQSLSVEEYLNQLVERELTLNNPEAASSGETGMVWENSLFVYRSGKPLPAHVVNDAIRRSRDRSDDSRCEAIRRMDEFGKKHDLSMGEPITRKLLHEGHSS